MFSTGGPSTSAADRVGASKAPGGAALQAERTQVDSISTALTWRFKTNSDHLHRCDRVPASPDSCGDGSSPSPAPGPAPFLEHSAEMRFRKRQRLVVIGLSTVFGALSGSAVAVAAMLGRSVLPLMQARGYDMRLAAGTILSGASLAPIIPPSLVAIIVGSLADVSIAGLLIAGLLPGLLLALLTLGYVAFRIAGKAQPEAAAVRQGSAGGAILRICPFLLVIFMVMGLIVLGIATPSESAATGVFGALLVAALFKKLSFAMLREALGSAVRTAGVILVIIASAKLFSQLLSFAGATRGLVSLVETMNLSPDATFLVMMLIPFFLCMFIDWLAFMLLAIPIYQPIVAAMGYDPIWFWTLFMINLTVGSMTPPFGYTLFALKGANEELSTGDIFLAAWPIVGIFLAAMACLWAMPWLVTALPALLR